MNRNQIIGAGLIAAVVLGVGGYAVSQMGGDAPVTKAAPVAAQPAPRAPVAPVQSPPVVPSTPAPAVVPAPATASGAAFRPFKCVNQRTNATVFELGRARNAQFMGQRNHRSFWKVDTPSRTVTFNTDVRDINCAFTG